MYQYISFNLNISQNIFKLRIIQSFSWWALKREHRHLLHCHRLATSELAVFQEYQLANKIPVANQRHSDAMYIACEFLS
jgi:hypothetical protein